MKYLKIIKYHLNEKIIINVKIIVCTNYLNTWIKSKSIFYLIIIIIKLIIELKSILNLIFLN